MARTCLKEGVADDGRTPVRCTLPHPHTGGHWHPQKQHWPADPARAGFSFWFALIGVGVAFVTYSVITWNFF